MEILQEYTRDRVVGKHVKVNEKTYDIEVRYEMGGHNFWTYRTDPRGIYLSIKPVVRTGGFQTYMMYSGVKHLLVPLNRYSQKQLKAQAEELLTDPATNPTVQMVLLSVVTKNQEA